MFKMLSADACVYNSALVREIQASMYLHPTPTVFMDATPQVVFDDESWAIFKRGIAARAKHAKHAKKVQNAMKTQKRPVRTNRDTAFTRIPFDPKARVVRISRGSFEIIKFKNFEDATAGYTKTETDDIYKSITGEDDSGDHFWIQC